VNADIDLTTLEKDLLDWVRDWSEGGEAQEAGPDTDLARSGLLDSMGLVALISYLEDETGATFDFGTFDADTGTSVRALISHCIA
jgi:acyl carrier protein